MCALAYLHMVARLETMIGASVQAALFARYLGRDVEVPDLVAARRKFDEALAAPPRFIPTESSVMLQALGLRGR